jgi:uncharacterized protein involved in tolerance to divalent cations
MAMRVQILFLSLVLVACAQGEERLRQAGSPYYVETAIPKEQVAHCVIKTLDETPWKPLTDYIPVTRSHTSPDGSTIELQSNFNQAGISWKAWLRNVPDGTAVEILVRLGESQLLETFTLCTGQRPQPT